jgi:hypothetical protein
MDDETRFERYVADELDDMAGPGRRIDAVAMARAVATQPGRSRFSATRLVLAGSLAAILLAYVALGSRPSAPEQQLTVPAAASASPSTPATVLPGLVTEEIEPGVLRIIRDDAGHDLDEGHPDFRYDLDRMTITPDGTVWLNATYRDTDNGVGSPLAPLVWALGRPGLLDLADGIPTSAWTLVPLLDSSILVMGEPIVRVEGNGVTVDEGQPVRPVHGGTLWLVDPRVLAVTADNRAPSDRLDVIWRDGGWTALSDVGRSVVSPTDWCQATPQGVACASGLYLAGTPINQLAVAPDGAIWAVGEVEDDGGGLYRISPR